MTLLPTRLAGAPISWGVCEVPGWGYQLGVERVLTELRSVGLRATELGPPGFLPDDPRALRGMLERSGLRLVGGFLAVVLHRSERRAETLRRVAGAADLIASAGGEVVVLAAGSEELGYDHQMRFSASEWTTLTATIGQAEATAAARGLTLALHPHAGTVIEKPDDVRRFLETTGTGLCLDTGHLLVGGADPLEVATWANGRVRHVHLKDVDAAVAARVRSGELSYREAVGRGLYRPLGSGDIDVAALIRYLEAGGYAGWYVLEQDVALRVEPPAGNGPFADVKRSVDFIKSLARDGPKGG